VCDGKICACGVELICIFSWAKSTARDKSPTHLERETERGCCGGTAIARECTFPMGRGAQRTHEAGGQAEASGLMHQSL
jgi:hypothetical protein